MFRKSKEFCDVILNVGENKKLFAHKNVLAAVSPHLKVNITYRIFIFIYVYFK